MESNPGHHPVEPNNIYTIIMSTISQVVATSTAAASTVTVWTEQDVSNYLREYSPEFTFPVGMKASAKPCFALAKWLSLLPAEVPREQFAELNVLEEFHAFYAANQERMKPKRAPRKKASEPNEDGAIPAEKPKRAPRKKADPAVAAEDGSESTKPKRAPRKKAAAAKATDASEEVVPNEDVPNEDGTEMTERTESKPKRAPRKKAAAAKAADAGEEVVPNEDGTETTERTESKPKRAPRKKAAAPVPEESDTKSTPAQKKTAKVKADMAAENVLLQRPNLSEQSYVDTKEELQTDTIVPEEDDDERSLSVSARKYIHEGVEYLKSDNDDLYEAQAPHKFVRNLHEYEEEEE